MILRRFYFCLLILNCTMIFGTEEEQKKEQAECAICMQELGLQPRILSCLHKFHPACIADWLNISQSCPTCKTPTNLSEEELTKQAKEASMRTPSPRGQRRSSWDPEQMAQALAASQESLTEIARAIKKSEESCAICTKNLGLSINKILDCGHTFHKECIYDWLQIASKCPSCNLPVNLTETERQEIASQLSAQETERQEIASQLSAQEAANLKLALELSAAEQRDRDIAEKEAKQATWAGAQQPQQFATPPGPLPQPSAPALPAQQAAQAAQQQAAAAQPRPAAQPATQPQAQQRQVAQAALLNQPSWRQRIATFLSTKWGQFTATIRSWWQSLRR